MSRVAVLGASGAVGSELVQQALARGHEVVAISRNPALSPTDRLTPVAADVNDAAGIAEALRGSEIVLDALGLRKGDPPGVLTAGARAVVAAAPARAVSVGAFGTGPSAGAAGWLTQTLVNRLMKAELPDKVGADAAILGMGGTVIQVGPMKAGPVSPTRRSVPIGDVPPRLFPAMVSHATVAAAMLDAAEDGPRGEVLVTLPK
ncbi:flavin reductase [Amycolatopsis sp. NBRC 101858]|uniref:NAD(P)-dependent oxidoreductase n=1 Tax=Amycolatopsis sp. NBRC 101858 TaxID=3032200 RepID=UPI0024A06EB5|nr:NAD(P)H-binding protein [Amycolatopsis sp. NBRC 101858]GLY36102.1 flavin reductase [Amycolatopsis sp. NBRC 101858]